jgi:hypothetical protein
MAAHPVAQFDLRFRSRRPDREPLGSLGTGTPTIHHQIVVTLVTITAATDPRTQRERRAQPMLQQDARPDRWRSTMDLVKQFGDLEHGPRSLSSVLNLAPHRPCRIV